MPTLRSLTSVALLLTLSLVLFACEAKITAANYDKIDTGMTMAQVEKILGGKGEDETATGGTSITGAGLADSRKVKDTVIRWKDGSKNIVITFRDGKVFVKAKEGL